MWQWSKTSRMWEKKEISSFFKSSITDQLKSAFHLSIFFRLSDSGSQGGAAAHPSCHRARRGTLCGVTHYCHTTLSKLKPCDVIICTQLQTSDFCCWAHSMKCGVVKLRSFLCSHLQLRSCLLSRGFSEQAQTAGDDTSKHLASWL